MKKILTLVLVVLLLAGTAFAVTPGYRVSPGTGEIVQRGYQSTPPKRFRMVRFVPALSSAPALTKDSIVVWHTGATTADGVTVTTTTTSGDSTVAGIIVQTAQTPDVYGNTAVQDQGVKNWTWLQTYGLSQVDMDLITAVGADAQAGDALGTGAIGGKPYAYAGTAGASAQGYAGFFMTSAVSTDTDVAVFLKCE